MSDDVGVGLVADPGVHREVELAAVALAGELASFFLVSSRWNMRERGQLKPGETLVVLGASGGTGLAAIEIGKIMGARVIACASSEEKLEIRPRPWRRRNRQLRDRRPARCAQTARRPPATIARRYVLLRLYTLESCQEGSVKMTRKKGRGPTKRRIRRKWDPEELWHFLGSSKFAGFVYRQDDDACDFSSDLAGRSFAFSRSSLIASRIPLMNWVASKVENRLAISNASLMTTVCGVSSNRNS